MSNRLLTGGFFSFVINDSSSPKLSECLQKKKEIIEQMEMKLDTGIDRQVNCFYLLHGKPVEAHLHSSMNRVC